jgi:phosphomannomutase
MRKFFGTDGIRGRANTYPMTAEMALKVGMAAGLAFKNGGHRHRVVIGKDTRLSGYMLETRWWPASPRSEWTCSFSGRCRHLRSPC